MDYKGGTYVSQVETLPGKTPCVEWAKKLEASKIYSFGESSKQELIAKMKEEEPAAVDGLTNTWCVSAVIRGNLAMIHFVQTDEAADNEQTATNN